MKTEAPPSSNIDDAELRVVLAYEDMAAALRATGALARLSREAAGNPAVRLSLSPWSFGVLEDEDPQWRALASPDLMRAQLIVLTSCSATPRLSSHIEQWLRSCPARRRRARFALAALFSRDDGPDDANSPRLQFVRRLAREAGCVFFAPSSLSDLENEGPLASIIREKKSREVKYSSINAFRRLSSTGCGAAARFRRVKRERSNSRTWWGYLRVERSAGKPLASMSASSWSRLVTEGS